MNLKFVKRLGSAKSPYEKITEATTVLLAITAGMNNDPKDEVNRYIENFPSGEINEIVKRAYEAGSKMNNEEKNVFNEFLDKYFGVVRLFGPNNTESNLGKYFELFKRTF